MVVYKIELEFRSLLAYTKKQEKSLAESFDISSNLLSQGAKQVPDYLVS